MIVNCLASRRQTTLFSKRSRRIETRSSSCSRNRASQRKLSCYYDRLAAFAYSGLTEGGVDVTSGRIQIRKFLGRRIFVYMFRYFGAKRCSRLLGTQRGYLGAHFNNLRSTSSSVLRELRVSPRIHIHTMCLLIP
ncbi:hypothetical protein B0H19DRAFT_1154375 [Mycena capillaripes]|nr:hypothetical protein B0H19DRAFT_1154375 [Mycena capillaripes]